MEYEPEVVVMLVVGRIDSPARGSVRPPANAASEPAGPDPGSLAARRRPRRPLAHTPHVDHPRLCPCHICGFAPPSRLRIADEVRRLPAAWAAALTAGGPDALHRAAVLRDEIHGVTNRVARLVAQPGARV